MKTPGLLVVWCVQLLASCHSDPSPESHARRDLPVLRSVAALSAIQPGHVFPRHGLMLLYFLADHVRIHQASNVTAPDFEPSRADYGVQGYRDGATGVLPPLTDRGDTSYYALGNLRGRNAQQLPSYVTWNWRQTPGDAESARDRVVFAYDRVRRRLLDVYVTQSRHAGPSSSSAGPSVTHIDPEHTYRVHAGLLLEIQDLVLTAENSLSVFLFVAGYRGNAFTEGCHVVPRRPRESTATTVTTAGDYEALTQTSGGGGASDPLSRAAPKKHGHEECRRITLEVKTRTNGYARLKWDNVPVGVLSSHATVELYKDGRRVHSTGVSGYGTSDTYVMVNPGLQVKLVDGDGVVVLSGPPTDGTDRKFPVEIRGFDARLQLYARSRYAGARLYVKKTFGNWKERFSRAWVGFYPSHLTANPSYYTYKSATAFTKGPETDAEYDVYYYTSSMIIRPLAEARFHLRKDYVSTLACTAPWET